MSEPQLLAVKVLMEDIWAASWGFLKVRVLSRKSLEEAINEFPQDGWSPNL